jgi:hypothetical protein
MNSGKGLIGAYALVYVGLTVGLYIFRFAPHISTSALLETDLLGWVDIHRPLWLLHLPCNHPSSRGPDIPDSQANGKRQSSGSWGDYGNHFDGHRRGAYSKRVS